MRNVDEKEGTVPCQNVWQANEQSCPEDVEEEGEEQEAAQEENMILEADGCQEREGHTQTAQLKEDVLDILPHMTGLCLICACPVEACIVQCRQQYCLRQRRTVDKSVDDIHFSRIEGHSAHSGRQLERQGGGDKKINSS